MTCDAQATNKFKEALKELYKLNESPPSLFYKFSNASADSGWSFGQPQWDVKTHKGTDGFLRGLLDENGDRVFSDADISMLQKKTSMSPADEIRLNGLLGQHQTEVNTYFDQHLDADVQRINDIVAELRASGDARQSHTADVIESDPLVQLLITDFANQYGMSGIDHNGTVVDDLANSGIRFLKGESFNAAGGAVGYGDSFDRMDWLNYVTKQDYAVNTNPADAMRRLANVMKVAMMDPCNDIDPKTGAAFTSAQLQRPKKDPLILDLNGNGIETVAPNQANPILFDHTGEGIKTGTGWVSPNDGFLVLDRNGNGTIDDGTELFGDNTPLFDAAGNATGKAADGFDALSQQDTNADSVVNSSDANFANLRVWQDLNQDGISQAGELSTLDQLGIASINVGKTENSRILPNGNQIADLGTFVRTDGTSGSAGTTSGLADVNLASDTFHRSFVDTIPLTTQTETLPDMHGSGAVRDLREAASIQTTEGATLATALGQFAAATTRNEQRAQLDTLLTDWAATSGFEDMAAQAAAHGYTLTTNLSPAWQHKLHVLETFNGRTFYKMPWDTINAQSGVTGMSVTHDATGDHIIINMNATQLALLDQAYTALRESVYDALVVQTRLKPYLDDISLTLEASGNFSLERMYGDAVNDEVFEIRRVG